MISSWAELKYEFIDKIAGDLLDEAYDMGIRVGAEYATRTISFKVGLKGESKELTKTQKIASYLNLASRENIKYAGES